MHVFAAFSSIAKLATDYLWGWLRQRIFVGFAA